MKLAALGLALFFLGGAGLDGNHQIICGAVAMVGALLLWYGGRNARFENE